MRLTWVFVLACFCPALAHADSDRSRQPASPGVALGLGAGATAAGGLMLVLASESSDDRIVVASTLVGAGLLIVGPSAGHLYVGESGEAVGMSLVRGGAGAIFYYGVTRMLDDCAESNCGERNSEWIMLGGVGLWTAATVFDLVDAPRAATRANARTTIAPTGNGMAVSGVF